MRKSLFLLLFVFPSMLFAQVPEALSYEGIALNSGGTQLENANIALKISILDNAPDGTVLYSETQTTTTSNKGLFGVIIGKGTLVSGMLSTINWGINSKFLKVEMDVAGGTNYVVVNNSQIMSVPYALYSGKAASVAGNTNINDEIVENRSSNFAYATSLGVYVYNSKLNSWLYQSGTVFSPSIWQYSDIIGSNQSFAYATSLGVYVYNENINSWSYQSGSLGSSYCDYSHRIVGSNGNFAYATDLGVYAYNSKLSSWSYQSGTAICPISLQDDIVKSNGNFAYATGLGVYVYNSRLNNWSYQSGAIKEGTKVIGTE